MSKENSKMIKCVICEAETKYWVNKKYCKVCRKIVDNRSKDTAKITPEYIIRHRKADKERRQKPENRLKKNASARRLRRKRKKQKEHYLKNREKLLAYQKEYVKKNKDKLNAKKKQKSRRDKHFKKGD